MNETPTTQRQIFGIGMMTPVLADTQRDKLRSNGSWTGAAMSERE